MMPGFADDNARSVVDEEVLADVGAGMNVNACCGMGHFGNDAGNDRHLQQIKLMSDAVVDSWSAWKDSRKVSPGLDAAGSPSYAA